MQKMRSTNVWKGTEGFGVAESKYHVPRMGGGGLDGRKSPTARRV